MAQQTIQYGHSKPIPNSLATIGVAGSVNIDRNRVGNSLNKPLPIDSIGLKSTIAKTGNRGHSLISNDGRITNNISSLNPLDDVKSQNKAILRADNPLLQKKDVPSRDGSNSQRSFRIRKGYVRSISRGSNLSQDHANQGRLIDNNQNTIEHPTDIEDNKFDPEQSRDFSEFEHLNQSPDIKLKSIEIDDELTGKRQKKRDGEPQQLLDIDEFDNSETGHKASKKTNVQSNSYGSQNSS